MSLEKLGIANCCSPVKGLQSAPLPSFSLRKGEKVSLAIQANSKAQGIAHGRALELLTG